MSRWLMITIITGVFSAVLGFAVGFLLTGRGPRVDGVIAQPAPQIPVNEAVRQVRDETTAALRDTNEKLQKTIEQLNQTTRSVNQRNDLVNQLKQEKNALAEELSHLRKELAEPNAAAQTDISARSAPNVETTPKTTETSKAKTEEKKVPPGDIIVYITKTGKKYHRPDCPSLSKSKIPIKLSEAKARGYTPCQRCKPPGEGGKESG